MSIGNESCEITNLDDDVIICTLPKQDSDGEKFEKKIKVWNKLRTNPLLCPT